MTRSVSMTRTGSLDADGWWPVATEAELAAGDWLVVHADGRPWLLTRLDGEIRALVDECPHRRVPLSAGALVATRDGEGIACRYHGWVFGGSGACSAIPALGIDAGVPRGMRVATAAVEVVDGVVRLAPEPAVDSEPRLHHAGAAS
jgi:phenylpropionate dioxygenase-like ring-hydroxylating dioxygenase large terminal subunit